MKEGGGEGKEIRWKMLNVCNLMTENIPFLIAVLTALGALNIPQIQRQELDHIKRKNQFENSQLLIKKFKEQYITNQLTDSLDGCFFQFYHDLKKYIDNCSTTNPNSVRSIDKNKHLKRILNYFKRGSLLSFFEYLLELDKNEVLRFDDILPYLRGWPYLIYTIYILSDADSDLKLVEYYPLFFNKDHHFYLPRIQFDKSFEPFDREKLGRLSGCSWCEINLITYLK